MNILRILLNIVCIGCVLAGCRPGAGGGGAKQEPKIATAPAEQSNVFLYVLNSSRTLPDIDIQVWIDSQMVVDDEFRNGVDFTGLTNHSLYSFSMKAGKHTYKAATERGKTAIDGSFTVREGSRMYILVGYEYDPGIPPATQPGQFRILFQKEPFRFE